MRAPTPETIAKRPTQKRARERVESILLAAEQLLLERGLDGFSIPVIADELGYTRGSVYAYFPTPSALLNELAKRHLGALRGLYAKSPELGVLPWRRGIETAVAIAADYHNAHPVGRLIILGSAVTDYSYAAQEYATKRVADAGRAAWKAFGIHIPASNPDVASLAVDLGVACLRRSVREHGEITAAYRDAAAKAMTDFLAPYIEGSA